MINCTVVPLENYHLYESYGNNPELFNLMSRTCTAFFAYEPGLHIQDNQKLYILKDADLLLASLDENLCEILASTTPWEMYLEFKSRLSDFSHLPMMKMYNEPEMLLAAMKMRALRWKKLYKGPLLSKNGLRRGKFGSDITKNEGNDLDTFLHSLQQEYNRRIV